MNNNKIKSYNKNKFMEFESKIISRQIGDILYASGYTIGTAESCTGGRISEAIMAIPGSSNYYKGGVVAYTDEVKEKLLGISHEVLEEKSAVSEEVAREMVLGTIKNYWSRLCHCIYRSSWPWRRYSRTSSGYYLVGIWQQR